MRGTYGTALVVALLSGTSALAQTVAPAQVRQSVDGNGVDLFLGTLNIGRQDASIGLEGRGLTYSRIWRDGAWVDNYDIHLYMASANTITVTSGSGAESFTGSGPTYSNAQGAGSTLTRAGSAGAYVYTYTTSDGTVYSFKQSSGYTALNANDMGRVDLIKRPDGLKLSFSYVDTQFCKQRGTSGGQTFPSPDDGDTCLVRARASRANTITSNMGYQLSYTYKTSNSEMPSGLYDFYTVTGSTLTNLATSATQSASYANSGSSSTAVDSAGRSWSYSLYSNSRITAIQRPGHSADILIGYDGNGRVQSYRDPTSITTTYSYLDTGTERKTTITVGANAPSSVVFDIASRMMKRSVDELSHTTSYEYDPSGRLTKVTANDGNWAAYEYDSRGNLKKTTAHPKGEFDRTLPDIVTQADFDPTCANTKTCNKPNYTIDARSFGSTDTNLRTNYTYDPNTGMITSVTLPIGANTDRPRILYDYETVTSPWGGGGTLTRLKTVRSCRAPQTCAGMPNETVVETTYGGSSDNYVPLSVKTRAGDTRSRPQCNMAMTGSAA